MSQDYGVKSQTYQNNPFLGGHPPITKTGVLVSGQNLTSGTVCGKITASGKLTILAPAASDGSEDADTIIFGDLDASSGDENGVFMDHCEAIEKFLTWPDGITVPQKAAAITQLKAKGIYVK